MEAVSSGTSFGLHFGQVAWVVRDIQASEKFFREVLGVQHFARMENLKAEELDGTYMGKPGNFAFHLSLGYTGETMIELIQPVSGQSMYQDYLNKHPEGGVQHIAFVVPETGLDKAVAELTSKGYRLITSLNLPVAKVAYFDTYKELGVATEIIGITEAGVEFVQQLKSSAA
ncbi:MAG: hypothetical protein EOO06_17765 [Chitinophagaceae bacterium]|nr:MAG: hypothetical protein EOO06_17765 [Chitinophagaceae bacterium]